MISLIDQRQTIKEILRNYENSFFFLGGSVCLLLIRARELVIMMLTRTAFLLAVAIGAANVYACERADDCAAASNLEVSN